jgi:hypothetical protein
MIAIYVPTIHFLWVYLEDAFPHISPSIVPTHKTLKKLVAWVDTLGPILALRGCRNSSGVSRFEFSIYD